MGTIIFVLLVVGIVMLIMKIFRNSRMIDNLARRIDRLERQVRKSSQSQERRRTEKASDDSVMVTFKTETYDLRP